MPPEEHEDSECIGHEPCPECGSKDNLGRYTDGHAYCFGCGHYEHGDKQEGGKRISTSKIDYEIVGEYKDITKRKITEETCRKFGYAYSELDGRKCQVAPFRNSDGEVVAHHIRYPNKDFKWMGSKKESVGFFGQHLFNGGKMLCVTEGELDALALSQMQGNKWPVVSVSSGSKGAKKDFIKSMEWLEKFEEVIICFDMDDPGQKAAIECAEVLSVGKAKIAHMPLKDANDMLVAGKQKEMINAIWQAKSYRPDGIVLLSDIRERVLLPPEKGLPWWTNKLTELTYGRRTGEVYAFGAGTGCGKTDFLTQQAAYDVEKLKEKVGVFFLEQHPSETAKRICGKSAGKRFHIPDDGWTTDELISEVDTIDELNALFMYNHFGCTDWKIIKSRIKFLARSEGIRLFYLDHLTALATEREELEEIMADIGGLVKELDVIIHLVSHLATPEGKPHEEGGRVMIRHFKGSRAIGFWCHYMFGIERDTQAEDIKIRKRTTFRVLKDRLSGQATGQTYGLGYEVETGRLFEAPDDCPDKEEDIDDDY